MDGLKQIISSLTALNRRQQLAIVSIAISALVVLAFGMATVQSTDYLPVYKNLSPANAARVDTALSTAGIRTKMSEDGAAVSVPREDLARSRMILAEAGLPIQGEAGWELFDNKSGLAMNSFLQRINRLRAMEGELARSIQTLDGIQSARVHLVMPQREAFSRTKVEPRASVIVRPIPGRAVSRKQAIAIRNLIASSVAGLDLGRVTVLSANGNIILAEGGTSLGQVTLQSTKAAVEDRMAREVEKILSARVGADNVRVSVNVELSSESEKVVQQSFNPDEQVVRSTENRVEKHSETAGRGNVGVENNLPKQLAQDSIGAGNNSSSQTRETVSYEIGNTKREIVRKPGKILRVSTAVLINGIFTVDGSKVVYSDRTPKEIKMLGELAKTAVGYDPKRGDTISIKSLRFMDYSMETGQPVTIGLMQQIANNIGSILRGIFALMIVAIVMIFGLRPAIKLLADGRRTPLEAGATEPPTLPADNASSIEAGTANGAETASAVSPAQQPAEPQILGPDELSPTLVKTMGVQGRLMKHRIDSIQKLASERPDDALRVLRSWLAAEAS